MENGVKFRVLYSQDYGDNWKAIVAINEDAGVIVIQLNSNCYDQLDSKENPKTLTLSAKQAFSIKPIKGSFFNGGWISKNK